MAEDSPLLLYSLAEFREIIEPCLEAVQPRAVAEVGSEHGTFTSWLLGAAPACCEAVHVVEPAPEPALHALLDDHPRGRLWRARSPEALFDLPPCDVYFLDGDHNYATVRAELDAVSAVTGGRFPLVFLHDVCWPWGRRDVYYEPDRLAEGDRHEYSSDAGPRPGVGPLSPSGFGAGTLKPATHEGGPCNGVKTAIEDFLRDHAGSLVYREVPLVFGLGVVYARDCRHAEVLDDLLEAWDGHDVLARVETDRIRIFAELMAFGARLGSQGEDIARLQEKTERLERELAESVRVREELSRRHAR